MGVKINYKAILIIETDKGGAMNLVVGPLIYDKLWQHITYYVGGGGVQVAAVSKATR